MARPSRSRKQPRPPGGGRAAKRGPARGAAPGASAVRSGPDWRDRFGNDTLQVLIVVLVAFLAYANAWPNVFVFDDAMFSPAVRPLGLGLADLRSYFMEDVWAVIGGDTALYRPLLLVSLALDMKLFGDWLAGYHLVNVLLHVAVSVAVFGFLRQIEPVVREKRAEAAIVPLLASLVFAVHPIHTEVVNSVFNRSEMFVTLGVAGGLWWFLRELERNSRRAWIGLNAIYLAALFSKETGAVLPALTVVVLLTTLRGDWRTRLRGCLPVLWLIIPLAIYLLLRTQALAAPAVAEVWPVDLPAPDVAAVEITAPDAPEGVITEPDMTATEAPVQRSIAEILSAAGLHLNTGELLVAIKVWYDSLKLMVWPHPLQLFHGGSVSNEWLALGVQLALLLLASISLARKSPAPLVGLAFYYIAMLPASRIVGEAFGAPHLAERYLYLPSVGLTILLASGLVWLARRSSRRMAVLATLAALLALTPVTWARNAQWSSAVSLAESEYQHGHRSTRAVRAYVSTLYESGEFTQAAAVCAGHADTLAESWYLAATCGQNYEKLRRFDKAEEAYSLALNDDEGRASAHFALANLYLSQKRRADARAQFENAIAAEAKPFMQEFLTAEMLMQLYPADRARLLEARQHLESSIALQPRFPVSQKRLAELDEKLNGAGRRRRN